MTTDHTPNPPLIEGREVAAITEARLALRRVAARLEAHYFNTPGVSHDRLHVGRSVEAVSSAEDRIFEALNALKSYGLAEISDYDMFLRQEG